MNQLSLLSPFGEPLTRVEKAIEALKQGKGILLLDDEDRENEGDLIYSVEHLTAAQMALMIRECSGIVCLCLTDAQANKLELPPMVADNNSANQIIHTVNIIYDCNHICHEHSKIESTYASRPYVHGMR